MNFIVGNDLDIIKSSDLGGLRGKMWVRMVTVVELYSVAVEIHYILNQDVTKECAVRKFWKELLTLLHEILDWVA